MIESLELKKPQNVSMVTFSNLGNAGCPFISIITAFPELISDK